MVEEGTHQAVEEITEVEEVAAEDRIDRAVIIIIKIITRREVIIIIETIIIIKNVLHQLYAARLGWAGRPANGSLPLASLHVVGYTRVVVTRCPDDAEKIRSMETMTPKKGAISATAIHDVWIQSAGELAASLYQDPRQPDDAIELRILRRKVRGLDFVGSAEHAFLHGEKIVAAHGSNQQCCGRGNVIAVTEVLHEIKELPLLVSDRFEQRTRFFVIVGLEVVVAAFIFCAAILKQFEKSDVPRGRSLRGSIFHGKNGSC